MRWAVCSSSSWRPEQEVTSDMKFRPLFWMKTEMCLKTNLYAHSWPHSVCGPLTINNGCTRNWIFWCKWLMFDWVKILIPHQCHIGHVRHPYYGRRIGYLWLLVKPDWRWHVIWNSSLVSFQNSLMNLAIEYTYPERPFRSPEHLLGPLVGEEGQLSKAFRARGIWGKSQQYHIWITMRVYCRGLVCQTVHLSQPATVPLFAWE